MITAKDAFHKSYYAALNEEEVKSALDEIENDVKAMISQGVFSMPLERRYLTHESIVIILESNGYKVTKLDDITGGQFIISWAHPELEPIQTLQP